MKSKLTKITATALALTMCIPVPAFAADTTTEASGSFQTSFDVYSPALTIQVPVKADIQVNPFADSTVKDVNKFSVASNSIDIWNASVDVEEDIGIPVNATVTATITSKADDVMTEYNTFTEDSTSTKKRIHLELSEANKPATIAAKSGETLAFTEGKLNFSQFETSAAAEYDSVTKKTSVTKHGSLLSVDIAKPDTSDTTAGATYSTDPTKVTAKVGSFAITGVANANAGWKADDVQVNITYNIKASKARNITTPAITAPTFTSGNSAADVSIVIPNVGESTVIAMALHNDGEELYGDYVMNGYTVAYAPNATTSTQTDATITIPKDNATLTFLAGDDYKGKAQDFVIALSDGRRIVSTLTVN